MKASRSEPPIRYLASSPDGDVVIDEANENTPLILTRSDAAGASAKTGQGTEPGLTYGRYLRMVKQFIARDSYKLLLEAVSARVGETVTLRDVDEIIIRSEKHGSMYHVAKIELCLKNTVIRFAVNVTFSPHGKECMNRDFAVLKQLHEKFPSFLPNVYFQGEEKYQAVKDREESALMFLGEWFTGYHEFHLSVDPIDSGQKVIIWDYDHGYKFAPDRQGREIYKQAAKILTLYYDIDTFRQIFPWHHSAGDFIVRADPDDGQIDVKLITVRGYDPMIAFSTDEPNNKLAALIHFLCNLTIKMRLDRLDGIGDIVWAEEFCIDGVVEGFFDALKIKEKVGEFSHVRVEKFIDILQSLTRDDWEDVLAESLDIYSENDPDLTVILQHLNQHSDKLYSAVRAFVKA